MTGQFLIADQDPRARRLQRTSLVARFQEERTIRGVRARHSDRSPGGGEDVALRVRLRRLRGARCAFDQPADVGNDRGVARENGFRLELWWRRLSPTWAKWSCDDDGESGAGGAHSVELRMLDRVTLDALVSRFRGLRRESLAARVKGVIVDLAAPVSTARRWLPVPLVSPHNVGNDGKAALRRNSSRSRAPSRDRNLRYATLAAEVGQARGFRFPALKGLQSTALNLSALEGRRFLDYA